ncbi:uncharacterized protein LOC116137186 isoform X1 [Pistacia vera]|uniref:uncharacterized protein LOC116137186 isoform X1 n=1 Tax=Pistacia vera TaxID=55513 RepID=UPI00126318DE|nr:uncharacterized protein LOC116137186 isoform X1 [Pistacia vera]
MDEEDDFDDSTRSNSSRLTQEWLEEAKRMVASSPSRSESPSRLVGSPRFAAAQARLSVSSIDRRDPLSRSARRHRAGEGFSGQILSKSEKHARNKSLTLDTSTTLSSESEQSPADAVHKWFSNILNPSSPTSTPSSPTSPTNLSHDPTAIFLPPRQSTPRRSRFKTDNSAPHPQGTPVPSRRTFKTSSGPLTEPTPNLLSLPKNIIESAPRRSISSSLPLDRPLSPPKNLVESAHRRSVSRSTCFVEKGVPISNENGWSKEEEKSRDLSLNGFLKEQRIKIEKILNRESDYKAKIVLPGPSNSTSSMVAAICYAWLLENRLRKNKGSESNAEKYVVVPVMNVRRGKMWKHQQTAWLFHHVGLHATSLLFADEIDLESLMMTGKLNIVVVGQDVLRTNGEAGSQCTILTDNYCEDAYDLLQTPMLKTSLLAGILLDTQNLDIASPLSMTRDAEAVQLLLVGSAPNYRNAVYDQLTVMQDQRDNSFLEALSYNYGKSPVENGLETKAQLEDRVPERRSTSTSKSEATTKILHKSPNGVTNAKNNKTSSSPAKPNSLPAKATATPPPPPRGKNGFFLAKWFGFGSK